MIKITPIYISSKGGSIVCLSEQNKRLFQVCSSSICTVSLNLYSAKKQLAIIESNLFLEAYKKPDIAPQRKTTLKWNHDGELTSIDKTRILDLLGERQLTECELTCKAS
tara:strand:+ start:42 stop:368 length:327 start_codon:yes stop_codon:yes gene_type:complete